jgi:hypothetical protein
MQEVEKRGRKAKHLDHYTGPATILRAVGTGSFVIQYTDEKGVTLTYQRDASMISPVPPKEIKIDPSDAGREGNPPHLHQSLVHSSPIEEGEHIIIKDTKNSKTWYCAQVLENLADRIKVSYYTTSTPSLSQRRDKLWTGLVPLQFLNEVLLVRNVGLTALGSLTRETAALVANLKIAHQVGA